MITQKKKKMNEFELPRFDEKNASFKYQLVVDYLTKLGNGIGLADALYEIEVERGLKEATSSKKDAVKKQQQQKERKKELEEALKKKKKKTKEHPVADLKEKVDEYLNPEESGMSKSIRDKIQRQYEDGSLTWNALDQIKASAGRKATIQAFVPKDKKDELWVNYLRGYGPLNLSLVSLLDDESNVGKARLQAAVFAQLTENPELKRKALAFSQ